MFIENYSALEHYLFANRLIDYNNTSDSHFWLNF